jgi:hypothetical protein
MRIDRTRLAEVRRQIRDACPGEGVEVKHLGDEVWLVSANTPSPFLMAEVLERVLGCKIQLDCTDSGQYWKDGGAWRGSYCSHLRFRFAPGSRIMAGVFIEDLPPPPPPSADCVYFIDAGDLIKIGRSADPIRRMGTLQAGTGKLLSLLLTIPNGNREREFHERFSRLRARGEWFRKGPELLEFIEAEKKAREVNNGPPDAKQAG